MTFIAKPKVARRDLPKNAMGLTRRDYEGALSTLCAGCGHDSITASIVEACWGLSLEPQDVVKLSGIGCSSKTTAYFVSGGHGFNSVHGRMPSIATGANAANRALSYIGVSGDGDTLSIGLGQFCHAIRRNINMLYIIENNGVYGLTKGAVLRLRRRRHQGEEGRNQLSAAHRSGPARDDSGVPRSSPAASPATRSSSCRSFRQGSGTRVSHLSMCFHPA